jgi:DNA-binding NarL/FixJ family response regulator
MSVLSEARPVRPALPSVGIVSPDSSYESAIGAALTTWETPVSPSASADVVVYAAASFRSAEAEEVRSITRERSDCPLLVVSRAEDAARVRHAMEAGASGFVAASDVADALVPAILVVAAGQMSLPPAYRRQIAKPTFTTREKQILGLVVMGMSNGEIGRQLYLAESTVKSHLSSAFNKLGVRSRNEATALILDPSSGLGPGILRITNDLPGTRRVALS